MQRCDAAIADARGEAHRDAWPERCVVGAPIRTRLALISV